MEFTLQNGTTKTTNVLEINDGIIKYNPPISYFYTNGTVKLKLKYDGGSSNYVTFSIPKNLTSTDDIILKKDNENYLVRKSTNYKYNDLPIASTTSLGGIIVGDNLTIDSNGKLNAQSGGSAATIQVGTTTTGEPGTDAQVTNSGTSSAAVFDFVIPRGAKGEKGDTGPQGEQGIQGEKGDPNTLTIGIVTSGETASATITGQSPNQVLNLTLPKGEKGETGQDGTTPNIQVGTTTTLAAGSEATVTQRGTTTNPIFDFGIPKGANGTGITELSSEDTSNPIVLYNLDEGIYKLYGYIKYYPTYSGTAAITSPTLATVSKSSTTTYIQLLQPYGNKVIGYEITETSYKSQSDCPYDVGDIFLTTNSTNPSNKYAGTTWTLWGSGRVPVGVDTNDSDFNTIEKTGGEKEHTLTVDEMPSHNHKIYNKNDSGPYTVDNGYSINFDSDAPFKTWAAYANMSATGEDQPHNNMPPYITCYMWKRTS